MLVSHDLASIESVCSRAVWLHAGEVRHDGPTREVLGDYRVSSSRTCTTTGSKAAPTTTSPAAATSPW